MGIEDKSDDAFYDAFLSLACERDNPKLVPTIDKHSVPLDAFTIAWQASMAEERGEYPLISTPALGTNYFIFYARSTGTVGYLSFLPTYI